MREGVPSQLEGLPAANVARWVSHTAARAQLARILASSTFSRAERSKHLLNFLAQEALEGKGRSISEYVLAVEIFNRRPSFDSETDAIVRVEAGRLRHRLQAYYETEGREDPVLVALPPRTYVPVFRRRRSAIFAVFANRIRAAAITAAVLILIGAAMYWMLASGTLRLASPIAKSATPAPQMQSIMVLPFSNLSGDKDQEYFCDGLTEELLETLTKVEGLRVVSRTSAFQFKGKTDDVRKIAAQLNVGLVLEGSVRREGKNLRVAVQLVNAANGYHLWSRTFERELSHVFAIQREIAQGVVGTLRNQLAREHWLRPLEAYTPGLEAYSLYLKGLHYELKWNTEGLGKAIEYLEQAVAADPKYAAAFAGLAECYALYAVHAGVDPSGLMTKAKAAAQKALEQDSTLPDAHAAMGLVKALHEWDWAAAGREFQRAHELDPTDSSVHESYVMGYLVPTGRLDQALREILEAHDFDPVSPRVHSVIGMVHYFRREYDQAIANFRGALELDSEFLSAYLGMGSAYEQKFMFDEAIRAVERGASAWQSGMARAFLGHTYALMGRKAEAQALAAELAPMSGRGYVSPMYVAAIYSGLGDKDRAFEWLEKAYSQRSASLAYLNVNPRFDSLHSDPRFIDLIKRIHLG